MNTNSPGLFGAWYVVIPLNPRWQPVKVLVVIPVYVKISLSTLNRPYSLGNPFVLSTFIVVSAVPIPTERVVPELTILSVKLSNFKYSFKLSVRSTVPPWNSWEI